VASLTLLTFPKFSGLIKPAKFSIRNRVRIPIRSETRLIQTTTRTLSSQTFVNTDRTVNTG